MAVVLPLLPLAFLPPARQLPHTTHPRSRACESVPVRLSYPRMTSSIPSLSTITPIGPFSPFRSSSCSTGTPLARGMEELSASSPRFLTEMTRLQLAMQMGTPVDPSTVRSVAEELRQAQSRWESLLSGMAESEDFQAREYFYMSACQLQGAGESLDSVGQMIRWQADCMDAYADGRPPPFPPAGVRLDKLAEGQAGGGGTSPMSAMGAANGIVASPFNGGEQAFESPIVKEEYEKLCRDHDSLVKMGEGFGSFDPLGKIAFIDAIEAVEERWDVLFSRFALLGAVNPEFREQTEAFLQSMGLTATSFRELLRDAHQKMRDEAEKERMLGA